MLATRMWGPLPPQGTEVREACLGPHQRAEARSRVLHIHLLAVTRLGPFPQCVSSAFPGFSLEVHNAREPARCLAGEVLQWSVLLRGTCPLIGDE